MNSLNRRILALVILLFARTMNADAAALSFLIADEGNSAIHRVTPGKPTLSWSFSLVGNRDLQLIGQNRFLANSTVGYAEYDLTSGALLKKVSFTGIGTVESFRRLKDGRTIVAANGANAVVFAYLTMAGLEQKRITFPIVGPIFRMVRYTEDGHFLFGSGDRVIECDSNGKELRNIKLLPTAGLKLTVYKVTKKNNGVLLATTGYNRSLVEISTGGTVKRIVSDSSSNSFFYNDFQVMPNGHFFMTDWWGHGLGQGGKGTMLHEFDENGKEVWKWQDSLLASSPHAVIVLDGLNLDQWHDDPTGIQLTRGNSTIHAKDWNSGWVKAGLGLPYNTQGQARPVSTKTPFLRIFYRNTTDLYK